MRSTQPPPPSESGKQYRHTQAYLYRILKLYPLFTLNETGQNTLSPPPLGMGKLSHPWGTLQFFTVKWIIARCHRKLLLQFVLFPALQRHSFGLLSSPYYRVLSASFVTLNWYTAILLLFICMQIFKTIHLIALTRLNDRPVLWTSDLNPLSDTEVSVVFTTM